MRQRWWIGVVALLGVGLAILMFPRPDTGSEIAEGDVPTARNVEIPPKRGSSTTSPRVAERPRPKVDPTRVVKGANPAAVAAAEARNTPEANMAAKIIAPWTAITYTLSGLKTDDAASLTAQIKPLLADLRVMRRHPDQKPYGPVEARMNELEAIVVASPYATNETIASSLERYRSLRDEYQAAAATPPGPDAAPPAEEAQ